MARLEQPSCLDLARCGTGRCHIVGHREAAWRNFKTESFKKKWRSVGERRRGHPLLATGRRQGDGRASIGQSVRIYTIQSSHHHSTRPPHHSTTPPLHSTSTTPPLHLHPPTTLPRHSCDPPSRRGHREGIGSEDTASAPQLQKSAHSPAPPPTTHHHHTTKKEHASAGYIIPHTRHDDSGGFTSPGRASPARERATCLST